MKIDSTRFVHECASLLLAAGMLSTGMLSTLGCQPHVGPERLPVTGQITLDGQPLTTGSVVMQPSEKGNPAAVASVVNGRFEFTNQDGPGPGNYQIRILPTYPEFEQFAADPKSLPGIGPSPIPERYREFGALSAQVTASGMVPSIIELQSR